MAGQITNIEYMASKSVIIDWKFNVFTIPWRVSSDNFHLQEISSTCTLSLSKQSHINPHYELQAIITFLDCPVMLTSMHLEMTDIATQKSFSFCLKKENSTPNNFSGRQDIDLSVPFHNCSQYWKIKIKYQDITINKNIRNKLLENNLKELLDSEKHADFSIKTQNVTFKVHKGILSCRCDVLAKALESDMIEKQNSEMQLDLWDPPVMKECLSYIYTGSCELSVNPHQLFELANYFQLDELKEKCVKYLKENINFKTIVHTLELTEEDQYNLKNLRSLAYAFIDKNESSIIKDAKFQEYLSKSIKISNLVLHLRLAHTYNLDGPLEAAKKFIKQNHKEVLENEDCKNYFLSHAELLLDIFKFFTLD